MPKPSITCLFLLQLHLDDKDCQDHSDEAEVDFFEAHDVNKTETIVPDEETLPINRIPVVSKNVERNNSPGNVKMNVTSNNQESLGPSIVAPDANTVVSVERKSTIGGRKVQPKKSGVSS